MQVWVPFTAPLQVLKALKNGKTKERVIDSWTWKDRRGEKGRERKGQAVGWLTKVGGRQERAWGHTFKTSPCSCLSGPLKGRSE